jgi:hypothetical protein
MSAHGCNMSGLGHDNSVVATVDPTRLAEIFVGLATYGVAMDSARAARDPARVGLQREALDRVVSLAVLHRDQFTCQWCRSSRYRRRDDGVALEVDHILPWSAGGADHPVNLRTLCESCNQGRSNRVSDLDRRARPIALLCRRCNPLATGEHPTVAAYCLVCRAPGSAPYQGHLLVGGAVPEVGIPAQRDGDEDYVELDGRRPGAAQAAQLLTQRVIAQTATCPWCSAIVGGACVGVDGYPLVRSTAHPARLELALVQGGR